MRSERRDPREGINDAISGLLELTRKFDMEFEHYRLLLLRSGRAPGVNRPSNMDKRPSTRLRYSTSSPDLMAMGSPSPLLTPCIVSPPTLRTSCPKSSSCSSRTQSIKNPSTLNRNNPATAILPPTQSKLGQISNVYGRSSQPRPMPSSGTPRRKAAPLVCSTRQPPPTSRACPSYMRPLQRSQTQAKII